MSEEASVAWWWRHGKDRQYVTAADGSAVGWHDLVDDVAHPERPELADRLAAAVVAWRGADTAPETAPAPGVLCGIMERWTGTTRATSARW